MWLADGTMITPKRLEELGGKASADKWKESLRLKSCPTTSIGKWMSGQIGVDQQHGALARS